MSIKQVFAFIALLLVTSLVIPAQANNVSNVRKLWSLDGWSTMTSHKQGILICKTSEQNGIKELDFLNINTGKSLWNNSMNDMTKEYKDQNSYNVKGHIGTYGNTVIVSSYTKNSAFDIFTGRKMWTVGNVELTESIKTQNTRIIYSTYQNVYHTNVVDLLKFDLERGAILFNKKINLSGDDLFLESGSTPYVISVIDNLIFFSFCYRIQCYDIYKERVIWKTEPLFYTGKCIIMDINVYVSRHDQIDCETDTEYIDCYSIFTGKLIYRLNGYDLHIKDNKLCFYQSGCSILEDKDRYTYFMKDIETLNTVKSITFPDKDYVYTAYGTNYFVTKTNGRQHKNDKYAKFHVYDYQLNIVEEMNDLFDGMDGYSYVKVQDDALILDLDIVNKPTQKRIIVYGLPDYKKSNHSYKPPYNLIFWILKYILGRIGACLP